MEFDNKNPDNMTMDDRYDDAMEHKARNDVNVSFIKCPLCKDASCKAYRVSVNNKTFVWVSQCRQLKIMENSKFDEDYWLIDFKDFFNPIKTKVEDLF